MTYTFDQATRNLVTANVSSVGAEVSNGARLVGQTSGAVGILLYFTIAYGGDIDKVTILTLSGTFVAETVDADGGGADKTIVISSIASTTAVSTAIVTGTDDTDTTSDTTTETGDEDGVLLGGTTTSEMTLTSLGVTVSSLTGIERYDVLRINDEIVHVTNISGTTLSLTRGYDSPRSTHPVGSPIRRLSFGVTNRDHFSRGDVIRIGDEYMLVNYRSPETTHRVYCDRGYLDSPVSSHATAQNIFKLSDDFIAQADAAGAWDVGNTALIIGSTEQTGRTVVLSKNEAAYLLSVFVIGNASHRTRACFGVGTRSKPATSRSGCALYSGETEGTGMHSTTHGNLYLFSSTIPKVEAYDGVVIQGCTSSATSTAALLIQGRNVTRTSHVNGIRARTPVGLWSPMMELSGIKVADAQYGIYNVYAYGINAEITDLDLTRIDDSSMLSFIAEGTVKVIDSPRFDIRSITSTWASVLVIVAFTVCVSAVTLSDDPVSGVRVRMWNSTQDPLTDTPIVDELTGADGFIPDTVMEVAMRQDTGTVTDLNPVTIMVTKTGWQDKLIVKKVTDKCAITIQMEPVKLRSK